MQLRSGRTLGPHLRNSLIPVKPAFVQKFVWRGTLVKPEDVNDMTIWFAREFGSRVCYLGTIVTAYGREDAVFSIHPEDVTKFAVARLRLHGDVPSWWEDYLANDAVSQKDLERFS